jgi:hypothetical protein
MGSELRPDASRRLRACGSWGRSDAGRRGGVPFIFAFHMHAGNFSHLRRQEHLQLLERRLHLSPRFPSLCFHLRPASRCPHHRPSLGFNLLRPALRGFHLHPASPRGFHHHPASPRGFHLSPASPRGFHLHPAPRGFHLHPASPRGFHLSPALGCCCYCCCCCCCYCC